MSFSVQFAYYYSYDRVYLTVGASTLVWTGNTRLKKLCVASHRRQESLAFCES
jgi:hypothetical protein